MSIKFNVFTGNFDLDSGSGSVSISVPIGTYTTTNLTTDRDMDADSVTLDELADILATLIEDLKAAGILG